MPATEEQIRAMLAELKDYYANVFVMMEQSLSFDPATQAEQTAETNAKIQALMMATSRKSAAFQLAVQELNVAKTNVSAELYREVNSFCERVPAALKILVEQLGSSVIDLDQKRDALRSELLRIQHSHKGFGAYKMRARKLPKYFDEKI